MNGSYKVQQPAPRSLRQACISAEQIIGVLVRQSGRHAVIAALGGVIIGAGDVQAFIEEGHRHAQRVGNLPQPRGANPVSPAFVFLNLLEANAYRLGKLLLGEAQKPAALADLLANVKINRIPHAMPHPFLTALVTAVISQPEKTRQ